MKLSVLVPIYNEERTLAEIVRRVCAVPMPGRPVMGMFMGVLSGE